MIVGTKRRTIGFDRKIQLDWLDATADWAAQGLSVADVRERLEQLLEGKLAGAGPHSARGKTMTVLLHIWLLVPGTLVSLRDDGFALMRDRSGRDRLPLHWGMCVATYPFFRDVAISTGRLLKIQNSFALSHVTRRMAETWGDRSTVIRATQRIVRSLALWGVLKETDDRGIYVAAPPLAVSQTDPAGPWLIEAGLRASGRDAVDLRGMLQSGLWFPFVMNVSRKSIAERSSVELHPHGLNDDILSQKPVQ